MEECSILLPPHHVSDQPQLLEVYEDTFERIPPLDHPLASQPAPHTGTSQSNYSASQLHTPNVIIASNSDSFLFGTAAGLDRPAAGYGTGCAGGGGGGGGGYEGPNSTAQPASSAAIKPATPTRAGRQGKGFIFP